VRLPVFRIILSVETDSGQGANNQPLLFRRRVRGLRIWQRAPGRNFLADYGVYFREIRNPLNFVVVAIKSVAVSAAVMAVVAVVNFLF
jgi:hypothetical protein